jgi:hypothetical protein
LRSERKAYLILNQRNKGHNFERTIANTLKNELGHNVKTTRAASKNLDNCGIDLIGTDTLIQCKAGYDKRRPRYEDVYNNIRRNVSEYFSKDHAINNYPILLIHNIDVGRGNKRGAEHTTVTMTLEDYINIRKGILLPVLEIL